jgi:UDP:flavonoid glycosyltransferase YjiC (YdhE family)
VAHIHFAWELGGGLGHAGRLKPLVQEAQQRGHQVSLSLRDLVHTDAVLGSLNVPRYQAPVWLHQVHGVPSPQISLAEVLLTSGYLSGDALQGLFVGWRQLLSTLKPDLLVGDSAPTAQLAARSLGIRGTSIGIGFFLPPDAVPMAPLRDWETPQPARLNAADQAVLRAANQVLAGVGAAPLQRAVQVLLGDTPIHLTWPELDHYSRDTLPVGQRWWGPSISEAGGEAPQWPQPKPTSQTRLARRVFAYVKADHPDHAALLQALVDVGCSTLCYLPDVAAGKKPPVVHPLIHYAKGPVDLVAALPGCELCVCHAGEATMARALLNGVPLLLMPMQAEQFLISRRAEQTGAGINAAARKRPLNWAALINSMLGDSPYRQAAARFAQRYAGFTTQQHTRDLVDAFEALLHR